MNKYELKLIKIPKNQHARNRYQTGITFSSVSIWLQFDFIGLLCINALLFSIESTQVIKDD